MTNKNTRRGFTQGNKVMLNSFQHLHLDQPLLKEDEILNQVQDDNRRGFTQVVKNVVMKKDCHSRGFLSGIYNACRYHKNGKTLLNRCVEDPRQNSSGMTANLRGFTLIELLVVVLIIGILAAVAVPQYQKAVWKARLTEAIMWNANAMKAMELWVLENGEPTATKNFTQNTLDIVMPPLNNNYLQANAWGNEFEEPDNWASVITTVLICEGGNTCNQSNLLADVRWEKAINGNYNSKTCTWMNEKGKKICSLVQSIDSEYVPI